MNETPEELGAWKYILMGAATVAMLSISADKVQLDIPRWMQQHGLVVANPIVAVPGLGDLGLDAPRLVIIAGIVIAAASLAWFSLTSRDR